MSTAIKEPWFQMFHVGIQYYVAGRAATRAWLIPVAGNLLHHAVEMFLKGELSKKVPFEDIKKKYSHHLNKMWIDFKAQHSEPDLDQFDLLISDLDRFEKIRYPDEILKNGAAMWIGFADASARPIHNRVIGPKVPEYGLPVKEVDALVARLFKICRINPPAYFGGMNPEAIRYVQFMNSECAGWHPSIEPDSLS